jgi:hypothetical protein
MSSGLFERRVTDIHEPLGTGRADIGKFRGVFGWDPSGDWFAPASATEVLRRSRVLIKYGERQGVSLEGLTADLKEKAALVTSLAERGVEKFEDVVNEVWKYYATKLPPLQVEPATPTMPPSAFDDMMRKLAER